MAKAAKRKSKVNKKSARVSSQPKAAKKKAAKPVRSAARTMATAKIDPLNRKQYGALTPGLNVRDIRRAAEFYTNIQSRSQGAILLAIQRINFRCCHCARSTPLLFFRLFFVVFWLHTLSAAFFDSF